MQNERIIHTDAAPKAVGPYSQAIAYDSLVFCAGQTGLDPVTGAIVEGGVEEQAKQVLSNLTAVLEEAGSSMDKVLKTTVFLTDMNNFALVNAVYASFFPNKLPARTCVEVSKLPKDALVEIEVIAHL
jgi:2-iminobutanoate/2-iminopropanoate deaminase